MSLCNLAVPAIVPPFVPVLGMLWLTCIYVVRMLIASGHSHPVLSDHGHLQILPFIHFSSWLIAFHALVMLRSGLSARGRCWAARHLSSPTTRTLSSLSVR